MTFPAPTDDATGPAPGDGPVPQGGEPEALLALPEQRLTFPHHIDRLSEARDRIADFVHQSDAALELACLTILRLTPDRDPDVIKERTEATCMLQLLRRKDRT